MYVYVCVYMCVSKQTQEAQNVECRTLSNSPEIEAHVVCLRASLVTQRIKCLPAMQEISVRSLGQEDLLQKKMETQSSIPAWRIPWMEEPGGHSPRGRKESDVTE